MDSSIQGATLLILLAILWFLPYGDPMVPGKLYKVDRPFAVYCENHDNKPSTLLPVGTLLVLLSVENQEIHIGQMIIDLKKFTFLLGEARFTVEFSEEKFKKFLKVPNEQP